MGLIVLPKTLQGGQPAIAQDVMDDLDAIVARVNGQLENDNIAAGAAIAGSKLADAGVTAAKLADAAKLGLSDGVTARRGATDITAAESTGSSSYTTLTNPDQVAVTLEEDGLIVVGYHARWASDVQGRAAIFLDATQAKIDPETTGAPAAQEAVTDTSNIVYGLATTGAGLASGGRPSSEVTTGQIIGFNELGPGEPAGGVTYIWAAAGAYTVSIRFRAVGAGVVTVDDRHLWVRTEAY